MTQPNQPLRSIDPALAGIFNVMTTQVEPLREKTICPQCGKPMLLHFVKKPFRPIVACAECKTYVNDAGQIKTSVG